MSGGSSDVVAPLAHCPCPLPSLSPIAPAHSQGGAAASAAITLSAARAVAPDAAATAVLVCARTKDRTKLSRSTKNSLYAFIEALRHIVRFRRRDGDRDHVGAWTSLRIAVNGVQPVLQERTELFVG